MSTTAVHESASLIGRLGSSAFRLFTTTVATSLAGSCFSPESAHRPFHHGIRGRGGTIFRATLPGGRSKRTRELTFIHRPARDSLPPLAGACGSSCRDWIYVGIMLLYSPGWGQALSGASPQQWRL